MLGDLLGSCSSIVFRRIVMPLSEPTQTTDGSLSSTVPTHKLDNEWKNSSTSVWDNGQIIKSGAVSARTIDTEHNTGANQTIDYN